MLRTLHSGVQVPLTSNHDGARRTPPCTCTFACMLQMRASRKQRPLAGEKLPIWGFLGDESDDATAYCRWHDLTHDPVCRTEYSTRPLLELTNRQSVTQTLPPTWQRREVPKWLPASMYPVPAIARRNHRGGDESSGPGKVEYSPSFSAFFFLLARDYAHAHLQSREAGSWGGGVFK